MANFTSNQNSDYITNSATLRNLPPEFVGNVHWDSTSQNDRLKHYLSRNYSTSLSRHEKETRRRQTLARQTQSNTGTFNQRQNNNSTNLNGTPQVNDLPRSTILDDAFPGTEVSLQGPATTSTKPATKRPRNQWYDDKRQSLRGVRKLHEDADSFLVMKVNNIRKKLNWKDSKTARELPPRKRPRHECIDCDISLAIWDNSNTTTNKLPLVIKRKFCQSTKIKRETDPFAGDFVELKLDEPFIISQRELRVPSNNSKERMGLAKEYFMEIKITPRDEKVTWPPIPMLGKSDGERFMGMGTDAKDEANVSMIARYQHLPTVPEIDTPLSVFVYAEGRTFRTKYGLEVSAKWVPKDDPILIRKPSPEPELEPWTIDDEGRPFGRVDPNRRLPKPVSHAARKTAQSSRKSTAKVPKLPKITYVVSVSKRAKNGFPQFSVRGLKCFSCSEKSFGNLLELRHHLVQFHKNKVNIEDQVVDQDSKLTSATIMLETPNNQRLKALQGDHDDDADKLFSFVRPDVPFDMEAHYSNKKTPWSELLPATLSKEAAKGPSKLPTASDQQSILRRENKGHVPYQKVLPFRPQEYQRKKVPNKKLLTKHVSLQNPYTSISHRPVQFDDEDARSETDDEIDDSWFVDRHMEELDLHSWQENWTDSRRRLAKKWDWHVLHRERGITVKYLGDCLVRFVRMEKKWILREDDPSTRLESISALMDMMSELKDMKVINEAVCTDVMTMLYTDELEIPVEEKKEIEEETRHVAKRNENIEQRKKSIKQRGSFGPPSTTCAKCRGTITRDGQRAVRCCSLQCSTPNVWYHAKCAGLSIDGNGEGIGSSRAFIINQFMKTRSTWKCDRCTKGKAKEKVV